MQLQSYPGCAFTVPERVGEDCGRDGLDPVILEVEEEVEEEEASNPGLLLVERENGPGKPSSTNAETQGKKKAHKQDYIVTTGALQTWIVLLYTVRLWSISI